MAGDIRTTAKEILDKNVPADREFYSDRDAAEFIRLTGVSHATMVGNWRAGGMQTACYGFVAWYSQELGSRTNGSTTNLGILDFKILMETLEKVGKRYAWVASTPAGPKYGDICLHKGVHIGVSLGLKDGKLNRVDAGQGGPSRDPVTKALKGGHDTIKRTNGEKAYDHTKLQGWIDIEDFFGTGVQTGRVPDWLQGWWTVTWRGEPYYYFFDLNRKVQWTQDAPRDTMLRMVTPPRGTGHFIVEQDSVSIRWSSGTVERLKRSDPAKDNEMRGTSNVVDPLTAKRL